MTHATVVTAGGRNTPATGSASLPEPDLPVRAALAGDAAEVLTSQLNRDLHAAHRRLRSVESGVTWRCPCRDCDELVASAVTLEEVADRAERDGAIMVAAGLRSRAAFLRRNAA